MVQAVLADLEELNPLYHVYRMFNDYHPETDNAYIKLTDSESNGAEIAALYHVGNAPKPSARQVYVQRASDCSPSSIHILHPLYDPLQYPLLYPHATRGWGEYMCKDFTQIAYYKARLLTERRFDANITNLRTIYPFPLPQGPLVVYK
jgi:hypothetical protein